MTTHGTYALTKTDVDRLHDLVKGHWDHDQIRLVAQQIAPKATIPELAHFLHVSRARGLDPFAKQVYAIHRNSKQPDGSYRESMTIQVSIDGYRLIADRTGEYVGNDDPVFEERDGNLIKATVTVCRAIKGERCAFTASARMSEYRQEKGQMWRRMPYLMLSKCAESLALRKAFPEALSGIYTDAEMDQADDAQEIRAEVVSSSPAPSKRDAKAASALDEIDSLLSGPCADIATEVRDDLANGRNPVDVLSSLRSYADSYAESAPAKEPARKPDQRRETQAPSDGF